jgi:hypothetical protein
MIPRKNAPPSNASSHPQIERGVNKVTSELVQSHEG